MGIVANGILKIYKCQILISLIKIFFRLINESYFVAFSGNVRNRIICLKTQKGDLRIFADF